MQKPEELQYQIISSLQEIGRLKEWLIEEGFEGAAEEVLIEKDINILLALAAYSYPEKSNFKVEFILGKLAEKLDYLKEVLEE